MARFAALAELVHVQNSYAISSRELT
jgi:hypothetical protein